MSAIVIIAGDGGGHDANKEENNGKIVSCLH
jgi:hypothetical protein